MERSKKAAEKVTGTRLSSDELETLEKLAYLHDRTVSSLMRLAVQEFITREEEKLHPLSLEDAVSLEDATGIDYTKLVGDAALLSSKTNWGDVSGVYLLVNQDTRQVYVGSSTDVSARLSLHKHDIRKKRHKNTGVRDWLLDDLVVVLLDSSVMDKSVDMRNYVLFKEQQFIDRLKRSKEWEVVNQATAFGKEVEEEPVKPKSAPVPKEVKPVEKQVEDTGVEEDTGEEEGSPVVKTLEPVLVEACSSQDFVRAMEFLETQGYFEEALQYVREYDSPWLKKLHESGRFPAVSKYVQLL